MMEGLDTIQIVGLLSEFCFLKSSKVDYRNDLITVTRVAVIYYFHSGKFSGHQALVQERKFVLFFTEWRNHGAP